MLIVVKIILVALAVFGQAKLFPEHAVSTESSLDSLILPEDKPELALAHRAMEAQGLCPTADGESTAAETAKAPHPAKTGNGETAAAAAGEKELASSCP